MLDGLAFVELPLLATDGSSCSSVIRIHAHPVAANIGDMNACDLACHLGAFQMQDFRYMGV